MTCLGLELKIKLENVPFKTKRKIAKVKMGFLLEFSKQDF